MFSEISKDIKKETIADTCTKHNITFKELFKLFKSTNPVKDTSSNKCIYKRGERYVIMKTMRTDKRYYGIYDSLEEARYVRDKLFECNWDITQLPQIKKEIGEKEYGNNK